MHIVERKYRLEAKVAHLGTSTEVLAPVGVVGGVLASGSPIEQVRHLFLVLDETK